jgi:methyl-accepting chemotaxis protein
MKITDFKIGTRLVVGFGALLAMVGVLLFAGLSNMATMNHRFKDLVEVTNLKTELLSTMSESVHIAQRVTRTMVLLDDPAAQAAEKRKIAEARQRYDVAQQRLETTPTDDRGRALRTEIKNLAAESRGLTDQVLEMAAANKDQEATQLLMEKGGPAATAWQDAIDRNMAIQVEAAAAEHKEAGAAYDSARSLMIGLGVVALLFGTIVAFVLTRSITTPLSEASQVADRLAEGDLTASIDNTSRDEVGQLMTSMQNMISKLTQVVTEVNSGSEALSSASEEVSATAQSLSQASSAQASSVEETSASIEEMTASISQNTENAKLTDGMATNASKEAAEGGDAVKQTVQAMKQIAQKIGIIDDIAYQTNLLALNAAIEAARAGEHGKGFAVVATEVRKLAERSQVAALEIGTVATNSVELAERAGKLLDEIVPAIKKTSDLVQEIAAASLEQSAGVSQINTAVGQLNRMTQQNAASSEELAATSETMSAQAEQLRESMAFFKLNQGQKGKGARRPRAKVSPSASAVAPRPAPAAPEVHVHKGAHSLDDTNFAEF